MLTAHSETFWRYGQMERKNFAPKSLSANQVAVVIESSNKRCDYFAEGMKNANNNNLKYHSSYYSTYAPSTKIEQYITTKRKLEQAVYFNNITPN